MSEGELHVLIVDDHELLIVGMKSILKSSSCPYRVSSAMTRSGVFDILKNDKVDVVVMEVELEGMMSFDIIPYLKRHNEHIRIVINTVYENLWTAKKLMKSGVDGLLFKSSAANEFLEAMHCVASGNKYYCSGIDCIRNDISRRGRNAMISDREMEVLKLIAEGKVTNEIAEKLCVSVNTVDTHRRHLMDKLDVRNAAELVMVALSYRIIPMHRDCYRHL